MLAGRSAELQAFCAFSIVSVLDLSPAIVAAAFEQLVDWSTAVPPAGPGHFPARSHAQVSARGCSTFRFPLPFGFLEPLSHLLVAQGVPRPPRRRVPQR